MSSVVIYGDVSPNIIDGSSIWLVSAAEVLAGIFDEVYLLLKHRLQNDKLISSVASISNVKVVEPDPSVDASGLTPDIAAREAQNLIRKHGAGAVVVRGLDACNSFSQFPEVSRLLWSYVTDLPFPPERISKNNLNRLNRIAHASAGLFAQTEAARSYLEAICPAAAGKTYLMRPMIPAVESQERELEALGSTRNPLRLIYSGKFAEPWKTLEMLTLPAELEQIGIHSELVVVGDKYNKSKTNPHWVGEMKAGLQAAESDSGSGVRWLGALDRAASLREISHADLGIGWRTRELDSSLEISTKALEYSLSGTPPILNRTSDHETVFGNDYPFFVPSHCDVPQLARVIGSNLQYLETAKTRALASASAYTMARAQRYLRTVFERAGVINAGATRLSAGQNQPIKIVVASHDMKFMGELIRTLESNPGFEVKQDNWTTLHDHDEEVSLELARWADVVFCEWAGPALQWYSRNVGASTRLYSRLHRFEMNGKWMAEVDWDRVTGMVFVSAFIRDLVVERFPVDIARTHVIPNAIDTLDFDRDKLPNANFHLGLVGYVPFLKRPDRAVGLLKELLALDNRYTLHLKGRLPWDYPHEWNNPVQRQAYLELFEQLTRDDVIRDKIVLEPFSADIASWQRQIGFMLSPSSLESFHLSPAEGMAAGSIPIVWPREGAEQIFGAHVYQSVREAAGRILSLRDGGKFAEVSAQVKQEAQKWDIQMLQEQWISLFVGASSNSKHVKD